MRIEISAGGVCGVSVLDFRSEMGSFLSAADDVIASFKTIKSSTYSLSGGIGNPQDASDKNLQDALDSISARIREEEEKKASAEAVQKRSSDFLELAVRVDKQVAQAVNKNKEEDYRVMPWLAAAVTPLADRAWYEEAWNWLCGVGEDIAEGAEKAWDWVSDTAQKAWDGLVEFYDKHWYEIINWGVTILCAVGSIVAIALIPVTGGLSILVVAGVSAISGAIVAATRSITTQQRDKGEVDWGEVGKEAAMAAVVGTITGTIGAGVGGAITSQLSNTGLGSALLGSSSTATRMVTGAVIGSFSEVVSGVMTRGAAEATQSYLETGSVDFGDVWDAATDPQQIVWDAAVGGASGGFAAKNAPEPTQPKYGSVHDEGFPEESMQAVSDYVGPNHYQEINQSYYDSSVELSPQNQKIDLELTKTLDQSATPESMTTYHGGSLREMGDLGDIALKYKNDPAGLQKSLEGKIYTKQGYMSAGEPGLAKTYIKDLYVTMDVPAGAKGLDVSISAAGKSEYLFPANCQQQIISAEWQGNKLNVHTKMVDAIPAAASSDSAIAPSARATYQSDQVSSTFSRMDYMEAKGEAGVFEIDVNIKDPGEPNSYLPKASGRFAGEIGNSDFIPNNSKALAKMKEYAMDSVPYSKNIADFTACTQHPSPWGTVNGKVEIGHMTDQRMNGKWEYGRRPKGTSHDPAYDIGNFAQADNEVAKQFKDLGITGTDIEKFRNENKLTWHECPDGKTMMLVPREIHEACPHSGGVSEMTYRMAWGDVTRPD